MMYSLRSCVCRPGQGGEALQEQALGIWQQALEDAALPDFTLAGPLELVLPEKREVPLQLPHPADVGRLRRIVLQAGAALTVQCVGALRQWRGAGGGRLAVRWACLALACFPSCHGATGQGGTTSLA